MRFIQGVRVSQSTDIRPGGINSIVPWSLERKDTEKGVVLMAYSASKVSELTGWEAIGGSGCNGIFGAQISGGRYFTCC